MIESTDIMLDKYYISSNGFLPTGLPLEKLPSIYYAPWENLAADLPNLIKTGQIRDRIDALPTLSTKLLENEAEWRRACVIMGFLTHAYIWGGEKPRDILPPCIARPFLDISSHLGLPPCATYAALTLWNFTPVPGTDITDPDNLHTLTSFTGTKDEEWFMVISVAIEAKGSYLLSLILDATAAAAAHDTAHLTALLCRFTDGLQDLTRTLKRMYEHCAPAVFFHHLRPFLAGSKNMVAAGLPHGVFYDVGGGRGEWHQYSGGSNAQSSLIQMFDIFLGVSHSSTGFIQDMRQYMPAPHRRFLEALTELVNVRSVVLSSQEGSSLKEAYNAAVMTLSAFRDSHIQMVSRYIIMPARSSARAEKNDDRVNLATASARNGTDKNSVNNFAGTGGTSLMPFLKQTRDTTKDATC